ncbi:Glycogen synthase, ADP-glucose transglucosylase [Streptococcus sp. DD10]|uniref:glycogen synthase GlgA n=1 Tax=Streptococcus sp. DD10 TaxID=1777878 RepID=UPI000793552C|nr:glycogen synthase GlgA [Streptococcus sp. DD10]KXT76361.1 Glycogen synthase, ADP-glucose transglucosylase [Streptococcus sp. DD10]
MKILFAASEGAPFSKTGGLGDVIGALPKSLVKQGHDVAVALPYYDMVDARYGNQIEDLLHFDIQVGWRKQYVGIKKLVQDKVTFYFVDNQYYFFRGHVYGDWDDGERFAYFQLAVLEMMERVNFIPDLLHVHDYHTAMMPFLLKEKYHWIQSYQNIRTVLTIHNLEFQGQFSDSMLSELFGVGYQRYADGTLRWNNCLNWMKAGILYADKVTTVSPSYAEEIKTSQFGCGLDQVLRMESGKLTGIVNGIDTDLYNPETDKLIPYHFSSKNLDGKSKNKASLQKRLNLPVRKDVPLVGIVSRLTRQKGFDIVVEQLHNLLQEDVQIVLLGTGDSSFEQAFAWFSSAYPEKMSANLLFDVTLAQEIYAASDIFLMPSRFEPCGLSQLMSMRYGTLPLVHEVGGLKDTVLAYNQFDGSGTGFGFNNLNGYWLSETFYKAVSLYKNEKDVWNSLQKQAMSQDFSWDTASKSYEQIYQQLV